MDNNKSNVTRDELFKQLIVFIDAYKHHHDLYIKSIALYFGILGIIAGFMYSGKLTVETHRILSILIAFFSTISAIASMMYRKWVVSMQNLTDQISSDLQLRNFPSSVTLEVAYLFAYGAWILFILAILNAFLMFTVS